MWNFEIASENIHVLCFVENLSLNANDTVFIQTQGRDVYGTSHDQVLPQSKPLFVQTFKYALN